MVIGTAKVYPSLIITHTAAVCASVAILLTLVTYIWLCSTYVVAIHGLAMLGIIFPMQDLIRLQLQSVNVIFRLSQTDI